MFSSLYIYAGIAIAVLFLVARIFKNFNAPKTIEQQRLLAEAKAKANDERREDVAKRVAARREAQEKKRKEREDRRRNRP